MQVTADFLAQAQQVIDGFFRAQRDRLQVAHGNIDEDIKQDNSPVTALDKALEAELRAELTKFDAGIGFEGEELGKTGNEETFWLIDPIDGTESFVRGMPFVRHMVTLISAGEPVYAYVYKPLVDELFTAIKGQGAYKNGERLQASRRPINRAWLELAVLLDNKTALPLVSAVLPLINGFRMIGDFTLIPEGKLDGMLAYQSKGGPWDYAPRALLSAEAGARVTNLGETTYDFRNKDFLIASPEVAEQLMLVIVRALAETAA